MLMQSFLHTLTHTHTHTHSSLWNNISLFPMGVSLASSFLYMVLFFFTYLAHCLVLAHLDLPHQRILSAQRPQVEALEGEEEKEERESSSPSRILSAWSNPSVSIRASDWRYFRVDLPAGFSSVSISLTKDLSTMIRENGHYSNTMGLLVCFRMGGPPLPAKGVGTLTEAAILAGRNQNISDVGQCAWFQHSTTINLTNEQVSSGVFYLGVFNDPSPSRTQSKMISKGPVYSFGVQFIVRGCKRESSKWIFCESSIISVSCSQTIQHTTERQSQEIFSHNQESLNISNQVIRAEKVLPQQSKASLSDSLASEGNNTSHDSGMLPSGLIWRSFHQQCATIGKWKYFPIYVEDMSFMLDIAVNCELCNASKCHVSHKCEEMGILYVRHGALPQNISYNYKMAVGSKPLSVLAPKSGWWYIGVVFPGSLMPVGQLCFVLNWRTQTCVVGRAGTDCRWPLHALQRIRIPDSETPIDSFFRPVLEVNSADSQWFYFNPTIRTSLPLTDGIQFSWVFFVLEIAYGFSGSALSVEISYNRALSFDIYVRKNGFPTSDTWDFYASQSSGDKVILTGEAGTSIENSTLSLKVVYPQEGVWYLGVRHPFNQSAGKNSTFKIRVILQGCASFCSGHGRCITEFEESGLTFYSFCHCDESHGGVDCSFEIISRTAGKIHVWALILSNAAAALPSLWAFYSKAYSEFVIFTSSGVGSALYHSCDAGGWCAMSYKTLQFAEFWLAFLAIIVTFLHFTSFNAQTKGTMHLCAAILTSIITEGGATRASNVIFVFVLGCAVLLINWIMKMHTAGLKLRFNMLFEQLKALFEGTQKQLHRNRFASGLIILAAASMSWTFETVDTYWFWHSLWHLSIYTSAFLLLWSTAGKKAEDVMVDHFPHYRAASQDMSGTDVKQTSGTDVTQFAELELLMDTENEPGPR